jgi:hypothetical protein
MAAKYYNYRASDGRRLNSNLPEVAG